MFSKLKDLFCKTHTFFRYEFFIPAALYQHIEAAEGEVSLKSIRLFFSKAPYAFSKDQLQITQEADKLFFVQIAFYEEDKRETFKKEMEGYKEVFPFWTVFPHSFYGAPRWNQGYQEHYRDTFLKYWDSLSPEAQQEYMDKYHCPEDWRLWLEEYRQRSKEKETF